MRGLFQLRDRWHRRFLEEVGVESPLEEMFLLALLLEGWERVPPDRAMVYRSNFGDLPRSAFLAPQRWCGAEMVPQVEEWLGSRHVRADFAFLTTTRTFVVELDGHEFHERTPAQAERDRSRDRAMGIHGWDVLRFTGREIHRDVFGCITEAMARLSLLLEEERVQLERVALERVVEDG